MWTMSFGREAVAVFIVLSGFCLMLPVSRRGGVLEGGAWVFFERRARRILPPYYFAVGLSLLMIWTIIGKKTGNHWDLTLPANGKAIVTHLLLVQDLFKDSSARINHAMWSISVEWRIYFLFPLLVLFWRTRGPVLTTLVGLIGSCLLVRLFMRFNWLNTGSYGMCPQFIGLFILGMLGAELTYSRAPLSKSIRLALPWGLVCAGLLALVISLKTLKIWRGTLMPDYLLDYFVGLFSMSLLVCAGTANSSLTQRALSWRPLAFVGTFSYSLYLMHAPFLQVLSQYVLTPLGFSPARTLVALVLLGTPIVVVFCYIFFHFCERPFLNVLPRNTIASRQAAVETVTSVAAEPH
jgi:peptidoglycan/LPS O-acetylase OafA/YrhL